MAVSDIQTSFAAGELSPQLYARVDLDKFQVGAALLRNFFVDYRGGASNRAGTEYIDTAFAGARLIPFIVSTSAAYVLVFSNLLITIYNKGVKVTTVVTPYLTADLFTIAYTQSADVLTLVHPNYPPADLSRTSDTTFTYTPIATGPDISPPVIPALAGSMTAPHSGPYSFGYLVTAVDLDGKEESLPSNPGVKHSEAMNETTNRVIGLNWTAPAQGVSRYNIYKWGPNDSVTMNPSTVWGFIGSSQTTTFTDNNIAADFSKQPPGWGDPFSGGQFQSITVSAGGAGYDGVAGDWPVTPYVPLTITGDGTGAAGFAVIDHALGTIIGVYLTNPGKNYTNAVVTANGQGGAGATFAFSFTSITPLNPAATAYLQQRRVFGGSTLKPETLVMSQPGLISNFNTSPVTLATDAIVMSIAAEEVNTIKSFVQVNYGLLAFTTGGSFLVNGGTPGAAIDANSPSVQPQVSQGANDLRPIRINYDVIYGQAKGNRIHNLAFAWQKQSYAGSDISTLAAHLFDTFMTVDWTYAEEPFKIVWAVRDDGRLLSLTYVPDQEVYAWCRHDTQGRFLSVCSVPEDNVDAVYVLVQRYIPSNNGTPSNLAGNWFTYLERMADRQGCCIFDAWFLDAALSLPKPTPTNTLYLTGDTGNVTVTTSTTATGPRTPDFTGIRAFNSTTMFNTAGSLVGVDWAGARLFVYSPFDAKFMSFDMNTFAVLQVATANANMASGLTYGEDGFLYGVTGALNQGILKKMNAAGVLQGTFGLSSSSFITDATHLAFPSDFDVCFDVNNTPVWVQACLNASQSNNEITVINLPGMSWEGVNMHATESTRNAAVTKGAQGVAYVLSPGITQSNPGVVMGLYQVNLGIVPNMVRNAGINANVIPGWTHVNICYGMMYDATDGNLIAHLETDSIPAYNNASTYFTGSAVSSLGHDFVAILNNFVGFPPAVGGNAHWQDLGVSGPAQEYRIVKFNSKTGAYIWSVVILNGQTGIGRLNDNSISKGLYIFQAASTPHTLHQINTFNGVDTTSAALANVFPDFQLFNDTLGILLSHNSFSSAPPALIATPPASWSELWSTFRPAGAPAPAGPFTTTGQVIQIGCGKILLTAVTNTFTATGTVIDPLDVEIPNDPNGTPFFINPGDWTLTTPAITLAGLGHLEGKRVAALADGVVVSPLTVVGGSVTLPNAATNIVVGLQYSGQVQTLYLTTEGIQEGSDQGKRKQISGITVRTDCTKGLSAGTDFAYLTPVPELNQDLAAGTLYTGDARVLSFPQWDRPGQTCIQQTDPLPATILGVIVEVTPGDTES